MEHLSFKIKRKCFNLHFLIVPGIHIKDGLFLGLLFKTAYKPSTRYIVD